jgi:hypothetical protein
MTAAMMWRSRLQISSTGDELAVSEVWCPLMADVRHFYTTLPQHRYETEENTSRKRIATSEERSDTMSGGKEQEIYLQDGPPLPC